jgi:ubiquinone/menaquinone biosynthesis C-methylase UbiE
MSEVKGWERIYREHGDLNFRVLPKIKRASVIFAEKGYKNILDLGCGTGKHSLFLASKGFEVYATDLSQTGIEIARDKAKSLGLANIHFQQHDMKEIPFAGGFFDAAICVWTIYHNRLADIERTLDEIFRVLKPGGMFVTDFLSISDSTFGSGREIERNTFVGQKKGEEDVPHHYVSRAEIVRMFSKYKSIKIRAGSKSYSDGEGKEYTRRYYNVEAFK